MYVKSSVLGAARQTSTDHFSQPRRLQQDWETHQRRCVSSNMSQAVLTIDRLSNAVPQMVRRVVRHPTSGMFYRRIMLSMLTLR